MSKLTLLFLWLPFVVLAQELEYQAAEKYLRNNQFEEAKIEMQSALKKVKKNKSKFYLQYANILKSKNQSDSSLYYYQLVEEDFVKRKIKDSLLLTYALKVEFYRYFNDKKLAEFYTAKLDSFELNSIANKDIVAFALNRKMSVLNTYHNKNADTIQLIKAIGNQILDLKSNVTKKSIVAYTLNELAHLEDYTGNKVIALKKYQEALQFAINHEVVSAEIDISINIARHYYTLGNLPKAIQTLEAVESKVENGSNLLQKYYVFSDLKNFYYAAKNFEKAYLTAEKCSKYERDISWNESLIKLSEIEKKFDVAKKEKELSNKESEIKIQNLQIQNNAKMFWLFMIVFLLTLLGSIALFYFFKREQKSNKALRNLYKENEFLLSEANHRINNNLQLIIILISGQIDKLHESESSEIKKILVKINSIATLHKHLYKSKNRREINIQKYLEDISESFSDIFKENFIESKLSTPTISVIIDDAMYIGLILTELYINAIKHAFGNGQINRAIKVKISLEDDKLVFYYADNGTKQDGKVLPKPALIDQLCRQMVVDYSLKNDAGFEFYFKKPLPPTNQKNT
ncbi:MAG: tetratricopeptide repeat-containing sensor histidine kinase [Flavobacterium sp.]